MGTTEKLNEPWRLAVKQRNSTPRPEALMQLGKLSVVCRAIRNENKSLRHRRAPIATSFEEDGVSPISCRFLHHYYFFGRAPLAVVSADRHQTIHAQASCRSIKIDKPLCVIAHCVCLRVLYA